jgi:Leucine-rich repeat (LRR) protein
MTSTNTEEESNSAIKELIIKGLKTPGFHPLIQRHAFLELGVAKTGLEDVEFIKNYRNIMYLDISNNSITTLEPLKNLLCLIHLKAT